MANSAFNNPYCRYVAASLTIFKSMRGIQAASVGGLFRFIEPLSQCPLMALSGQSRRTRICPLSEHSGQMWILPREGLSANDPKRTKASSAYQLYSAGCAAFPRLTAPGSPDARAAKKVMTAHANEQAARKYRPAWKLPVESLIQPTMKGPT